MLNFVIVMFNRVHHVRYAITKFINLRRTSAYYFTVNNHFMAPNRTNSGSSHTDSIEQENEMPPSVANKSANSSTPKTKKNLPDQFLKDGVSPIDVLLVYEDSAGDKERQDIRSRFQKTLVEQNRLVLETEKCESESGKRICFVKIHAPFEVLAAHAESAGLKSPLKGLERPSVTDAGILSSKCSPFSLPAEFEQATAYKRTYAATFRRKHVKTFEPHSEQSFFRPTQRIQMAWHMLEHTPCLTAEGNGFGVDRLLEQNVYTAAFPLHDGGNGIEKEKVVGIPLNEWNIRRLLQKFWANKSNWYKKQPLNVIHQYFGLQIAIYFAWLTSYTQALIPVSVVGIVCFLYGLSYIDNDIPSNEICSDPEVSQSQMCPTCPFPACANWTLSQSCTMYKMTKVFSNEASMGYVLFLVIWTIWFQLYWTRTEAELKYEWLDTNPELSIEPIRLQYELSAKGKTVVNPVTGREEPHVGTISRITRRIISIAVIASLISVLLFVMVLIIALRVTLMIQMNKNVKFEIAKQKIDRLLAAIASATISAVAILIFEKIYRTLAWKATEYECHRTLSNFEASFTYKMVIFQFVNYYGPMIYISFLKGVFVRNPVITDEGLFTPEHCDPGGCMSELTVQLVITMIIKQMLQGLIETLMPYFKKFRSEKQFHWKGTVRHQYQDDFNLVQAPLLPLVDEYLEMVIQYGFVAIFSVAFPLAPIFALLNNLVELRGDADKWTGIYRRPVPLMVPNIGPWYRIITFLSYVGVIVNAGLIGFTSDIIPRFVYVYSFNNTGELYGFIKSRLSVYRHRKIDLDECYYFDYRDTNFRPTNIWWEVFAAKVLFVLIFVVVAGVVQRMVQTYMSPVPEKIDTLMRRERFIVWQKFYDTDGFKATKSLNELEPATPTETSPNKSSTNNANASKQNS